MNLYREKTQIRLYINITDTGKREKCHIWNTLLKYYVPSLILEMCLIVLFCSDIKRTIRLKNVLLHDHPKR